METEPPLIVTAREVPLSDTRRPMMSAADPPPKNEMSARSTTESPVTRTGPRMVRFHRCSCPVKPEQTIGDD